PVLRPRPAVSQRDLLPRRDAEASRRGVEAVTRTVEEAAGPDRDGDRRGRTLLSGRGVPPGLRQEESYPVSLLPLRVRARRPAPGAVGPTGAPLTTRQAVSHVRQPARSRTASSVARSSIAA